MRGPNFYRFRTRARNFGRVAVDGRDAAA
eukprot:COSAG01_NODE_43214_length_432_cov_0.672673_1_plen_28_part_01